MTKYTVTFVTSLHPFQVPMLKASQTWITINPLQPEFKHCFATAQVLKRPRLNQWKHCTEKN